MRELFKMEGRTLLPVEKHLERITVGQLVEFCDFSKDKYERAKIEPGYNVQICPFLGKIANRNLS